MRGGGTLKGMKDLMHEFGAKVIGTGVLYLQQNLNKKW